MYYSRYLKGLLHFIYDIYQLLNLYLSHSNLLSFVLNLILLKRFRHELLAWEIGPTLPTLSTLNKVHSFNNMSGVNLHRNFAFACSPFYFRVITWLESLIQWKTSTWSAVNLKKKQVTLMKSKSEPAIWSRDTGQRIPCHYLWHGCPISKKYLMYGNGATILFFKVHVHVLGLPYGSTDSQLTTKFSKVWGSARAPLVCRSSATTVPLKFPAKCVCNRPSNTCLANPRWTNKTQDWTCMTSSNTLIHYIIV